MSQGYGPHQPTTGDVQAAPQAAFDAMGPDADRFFAAWAEMEQTEAAHDAAEPEPEAGG